MSGASIQSLLHEAVAHHQAGRFPQAESLYQQVLRQQPNQPDAMRLLGVLEMHRGRLDVAIDLLRRAQQAYPQFADMHAAYGQALASAGRLLEAANALQQARKINPQSPELCNDLANVHLGMNHVEEAIRLYQDALARRADFPEALNNLAAALMRVGRLDQASLACRRAIELRPNFVEAYCNLGSLLHQQGHHEQAMNTLRQGLSMSPDDLNLLMNLAESQRVTRQFQQATATIQRILQLQPQLSVAHNSLGVIFHEQQLFEQAKDAYRQAISLQPDFAEAHYNLGTTFHESHDEEPAIAEFGEAIRLQPTMVQAWNNMGNALLNIGRQSEAAEAQRRAIAIRPDMPAAHFNLGTALLTLGDLQNGFKEFEWRWQTPELSLSHRKFAQPRWNGERIDGKTILLHAEQGFGDTIQFIRYALQVVEAGGKILLACQPELKRLLSCAPGIQQITAGDVPLPRFDLHCPLMSLPLVLKTTLNNLPAPIPYLSAEPALAEEWREKFKTHAGRFKVGLIWAGRPTHTHDSRRSIALQQLAPLTQIEGCTFFSLQKGNRADQASQPPAGMELIDLGPQLHDFADTAAVLDQLDLLITVDTASAHLAGAMGRPVWVLLPFAPDWRWMLGRNDSPWYPTMRLFRQPSLDDWSPAIASVVEALRAR